MRQNNSFNKTYIHWQMNLKRINEKVCKIAIQAK